MRRHVVVLGAGISGLTAAWYLRQQPDVDVTILEKEERAGGWIRTVQNNNFLFELGPRSCRTTGAGSATLGLAEELGLADQILLPSKNAGQRFIYTRQKLRPVPRGPLGVLFSSLTRPLLWPLLNEWRIPPSAELDESIDSFFRRRLGSYAADTLIDPLTSGIYAGDSKTLSIRSCFPAAHQTEQAQGSLIKGAFKRRRNAPLPASPFVQQMQKSSLFTFKQGMEQLTQTLRRKLEKQLRLSCPVIRLYPEEQGIQVELRTGEVLFADHVVSALPSAALAALLAAPDPILSQSLASQKTASVVVVNLGYNHRILPKEGFGYLVPSREGERLLGMVWDSSAFPQQNRQPQETRLTCMFGGEHLPNRETYTNDDFVHMASDALERHLGVAHVPDAANVYHAKAAIPQYSIGHGQVADHWRQRVSQLFSSRLHCIGNSFDGVAVNDCVLSANRETKALMQNDTVVA